MIYKLAYLYEIQPNKHTSRGYCVAIDRKWLSRGHALELVFAGAHSPRLVILELDSDGWYPKITSQSIRWLLDIYF